MPDQTTFTVMGRLPFPLDMLRYDACWPQTGDDVAAIQASLERDKRGQQEDGYFRVTLVTDHRKGPTKGRWVSFNWFVQS